MPRHTSQARKLEPSNQTETGTVTAATFVTLAKFEPVMAARQVLLVSSRYAKGQQGLPVRYIRKNHNRVDYIHDLMAL